MEESNQHKGINPMVAGIAGMAVGATVGATAMALSKKENRKKLGKFIDIAKERGTKMLDKAMEKTEILRRQGSAIIAHELRRPRKRSGANKSKSFNRF